MHRVAEHPMTQCGFGFTGIVITIVAEVHNFAPEFRLQPSRGLNFGIQIPPWKKTARLLAEANNRRSIHAMRGRTYSMEIQPSG
jgi:hypothetical protein